MAEADTEAVGPLPPVTEAVIVAVGVLTTDEADTLAVGVLTTDEADTLAVGVGTADELDAAHRGATLLILLTTQDEASSV